MQISKSVLKFPERVSIAGFILLIMMGTGLLMLPAAATGNRLGLTDALFTATSASCVTGLAVVDTGRDLSIFGQAVLLFLIQTGGLGIMTLSTLFLMAAGKRPGLTGQILIKDSFTHSRERPLSAILRDVFLFVFAIEGAGMVLMFFRFIPERELSEAFHLSLFHSVSAFCNAGFSTFPDSFMGYREDWVLNLIISFLIICGGIGFPVLSELKQKQNFPFGRRGRWSLLSLHSKIVISATIILLFISSVSILLMEWNNTLSSLSVSGRFLAAFFQAVSVRTAGFNTLPIGDMANESLFLMMLLMFIGACPGSCGGGIKITTFVTLVQLGISRLRGKERPQIFCRTIPRASVEKAVSVVMISSLVVTGGSLALMMTELGETPHPMSRGMFLELSFDVVSAVGTVGLSTGVTGKLTVAGKSVITLMMFMGRLGPLVIAIAVSRQNTSRYYYAEENIMVG